MRVTWAKALCLASSSVLSLALCACEGDGGGGGGSGEPAGKFSDLKLHGRWKGTGSIQSSERTTNCESAEFEIEQTSTALSIKEAKYVCEGTGISWSPLQFEVRDGRLFVGNWEAGYLKEDGGFDIYYGEGQTSWRAIGTIDSSGSLHIVEDTNFNGKGSRVWADLVRAP